MPDYYSGPASAGSGLHLTANYISLIPDPPLVWTVICKRIISIVLDIQPSAGQRTEYFALNVTVVSLNKTKFLSLKQSLV